MPLPIAAAAGAGVVVGGANALATRSSSRRAKRTIREAYGIQRKQQEARHADIRQDTTQSLIGRGIMSAGNSTSPAVAANQSVEAAARSGQSRGGLIAGARSAIATTKQNATNDHTRMAQRSATGAANTLGGQVQRDLSGELLLERQDMSNRRRAELDGVRAQTQQGYVNAISSGIGAGMSLYNAFSTPMPGGGAAPAPTSPDGKITPVQKGAFGIDPVNPRPMANHEFRIKARVRRGK